MASPNTPTANTPTAAPARHAGATLALLVAVLGMGLSAIFIRWANAPGAVSGFYRMLIAAALMGLPFGAEVRPHGVPARGVGGDAEWANVASWACPNCVEDVASDVLS